MHAPHDVRGQLAGVVGAPLLFLLGLHVLYASVPWACRGGVEWPLHLVAAATLLLVLGCAALSARAWRRAGRTWPGEGGDPVARSRFLGAVGALLASFLALIVLAQWLAMLFFSPCQGA